MRNLSTANSITTNSITANLVTATALLVLVGGSVAVAQNSRTGSSSGTASQAAPNANGPASAPVGHRQPRAGDVPSEKNVGALNAEDAALDRKIKSICRGC